MVTEREQYLATLRATHEFPTRYTFKVIGANETRLLDDALAVVKAALPEAEPSVSRRESNKGNHQSITLILDVPDPETVHDIYLELRNIDGLQFLL